MQNLRWDTPKNNQKDKIKHGTSNIGERHGNAKLNGQQVRIVKWLCANSNMLQREIAVIFGVTRPLISYIECNKIWKHI